MYNVINYVSALGRSQQQQQQQQQQSYMGSVCEGKCGWCPVYREYMESI